MSQYIFGPMKGATSQVAGLIGLVPAPAAGDNEKYLRGDGTWAASTVDISGKADKEDTVLDTTLSRGRVENSSVGTGSFAFGNDVIASGNYSHAEGSGGSFYIDNTQYVSGAVSTASHAEGVRTRAGGQNTPGAHAEGVETVAEGTAAHSEGISTMASVDAAHAEGYGGGTFTTPFGDFLSEAYGHASHTEGRSTRTEEEGSHAEGMYTVASGMAAHAEGMYTYANAGISHAEGYATRTDYSYTHVEGFWNVPPISETAPDTWVADTSYEVGDLVKTGETAWWYCKTANSDHTFNSLNWYSVPWHSKQIHVVGNGYDLAKRSNAYSLDHDGTGHYGGDLYVNCNADSTGGSLVLTSAYLTNNIATTAEIDALFA